MENREQIIRIIAQTASSGARGTVGDVEASAILANLAKAGFTISDGPVPEPVVRGGDQAGDFRILPTV